MGAGRLSVTYQVPSIRGLQWATPPIILPPPHCPPPTSLEPLSSVAMSDSPQSPPRKRSNISQACRNCRHRKKKCDGQKPVCRTCQAYKVSSCMSPRYHADVRMTVSGTPRLTGARIFPAQRPTLSEPASPSWNRNCLNLGLGRRHPCLPPSPPLSQTRRCGTRSLTLPSPLASSQFLLRAHALHHLRARPPHRLNAQLPSLHQTHRPPSQRLRRRPQA